MESELDEAAREVVAMQFAGGRSIAGLAEEWERDADWIEEAIRQALLESIPKRAGGLKVPRKQERAERTLLTETRPAQAGFEWEGET